MEAKNKIASQVKELRQASGLSVRKLAELAGVHHPHIVNIEGGKLSPTMDVLERLVSALGAEIQIVKKTAP